MHRTFNALALLIIPIIATAVGCGSEKPPLPSTTANPRPTQPVFSQWQTYRSDEYAFEVSYPGNWVIAKPIRDDDVINLLLSVEDPRSRGRLDIGGSMFPQFLIRVFPKGAYSKRPIEKYLRVPVEEITTQEKTVTVSGQRVTLFIYTVSVS